MAICKAAGTVALAALMLTTAGCKSTSPVADTIADRIIPATSQDARIIRFAGASAIACQTARQLHMADAETACLRLQDFSMRVAANRASLSFEYTISAGARYLLVVVSVLVAGEAQSEDWSTARIIAHALGLLETYDLTRGAVAEVSDLVKRVDSGEQEFAPALEQVLAAFGPLAADPASAAPRAVPGTGSRSL